MLRLDFLEEDEDFEHDLEIFGLDVSVADRLFSELHALLSLVLVIALTATSA